MNPDIWHAMNPDIQQNRRIQALHNTFKFGSQAFEHYKRASGSTSTFQAIKTLWQKRNEKTLGIPTYGVQPFRHPIETYRTYQALENMRTSMQRVEPGKLITHDIRYHGGSPF